MSTRRQEELSLEASELHPDDAEAVAQGAVRVELVAGPEPEPRRNRIRGKTVSTKRLSKQKLFEGKIEADALLEGVEYTRPRTRGDCLQGENAQRPCPFLSCRFHLYLDVNPKSGGIKFNFDHLEAYEIPESCALDVADKGGDTLENIGLMMNLTRERVRQLEAGGLEKLRQVSSLAAHADHLFGDVSRPDLNEPEHKYSGIGRIEVSKALHRVVPNSAPTERAIRAGKRGGGTSRMPSEAMAAALSELRAELGTERLALELDLSEYTVAALCRGDNLEAYEIPESCALDVADKGGDTLENIGLMMNLTRERVRQLEASGLEKLRQVSSLAAHADHLFGDVSRPDLNEPEHKYSGTSRMPSEAMAAALSELRAELGTERLALELDLSGYTVAALCRGDNVSFVTLRKAAEYLAGRGQVA